MSASNSVVASPMTAGVSFPAAATALASILGRPGAAAGDSHATSVIADFHGSQEDGFLPQGGDGSESTALQWALTLTSRIPFDEEGNMTSIGSIFHHHGGCRPCRFHHHPGKPEGCQYGVGCLFCHFHHDRRRRRTGGDRSKFGRSAGAPGAGATPGMHHSGSIADKASYLGSNPSLFLDTPPPPPCHTTPAGHQHAALTARSAVGLTGQHVPAIPPPPAPRSAHIPAPPPSSLSTTAFPAGSAPAWFTAPAAGPAPVNSHLPGADLICPSDSETAFTGDWHRSARPVSQPRQFPSSPVNRYLKNDGDGRKSHSFNVLRLVEGAQATARRAADVESISVAADFPGRKSTTSNASSGQSNGSQFPTTSPKTVDFHQHAATSEHSSYRTSTSGSSDIFCLPHSTEKTATSNTGASVFGGAPRGAETPSTCTQGSFSTCELSSPQSTGTSYAGSCQKWATSLPPVSLPPLSTDVLASLLDVGSDADLIQSIIAPFFASGNGSPVAGAAAASGNPLLSSLQSCPPPPPPSITSTAAPFPSPFTSPIEPSYAAALAALELMDIQEAEGLSPKAQFDGALSSDENVMTSATTPCGGKLGVPFSGGRRLSSTSTVSWGSFPPEVPSPAGGSSVSGKTYLDCRAQ